MSCAGSADFKFKTQHCLLLASVPPDIRIEMICVSMPCSQEDPQALLGCKALLDRKAVRNGQCLSVLYLLRYHLGKGSSFSSTSAVDGVIVQYTHTVN